MSARVGKQRYQHRLLQASLIAGTEMGPFAHVLLGEAAPLIGAESLIGHVTEWVTCAAPDVLTEACGRCDQPGRDKEGGVVARACRSEVAGLAIEACLGRHEHGATALIVVKIPPPARLLLVGCTNAIVIVLVQVEGHQQTMHALDHVAVLVDASPSRACRRTCSPCRFRDLPPPHTHTSMHITTTASHRRTRCMIKVKVGAHTSHFSVYFNN